MFNERFFSIENDVLFHIFIFLWFFWILKSQILLFYNINYSALDVTLLIVTLDSRGVWTCNLVIYQYKILQIFPTSINKNHRRSKEGAPQKFFSTFTDEPERQLFIKKTVEIEDQQKIRVLIFTMSFFYKNKEKRPKKSFVYTFVPKILMITGYWDMEQDRLILVTLGHLLPLYSP